MGIPAGCATRWPSATRWAPHSASPTRRRRASLWTRPRTRCRAEAAPSIPTWCSPTWRSNLPSPAARRGTALRPTWAARSVWRWAEAHPPTRAATTSARSSPWRRERGCAGIPRGACRSGPISGWCCGVSSTPSATSSRPPSTAAGCCRSTPASPSGRPIPGSRSGWGGLSRGGTAARLRPPVGGRRRSERRRAPHLEGRRHGLPLGFFLATRPFWGRRAAFTLVNTALAFPTVVTGLLLFGLLSRRGPLGGVGWLYTWQAIALGDVCIALPIAAALSAAAVQGVDPRIRRTAQTLGASAWRTAWAVAREARFALAAVITAAFGHVNAEIGSAMMVGGNIRGSTRTLTTAIALYTGQGDFGLALALGVILLVLALLVNIALQVLQGQGHA